MLSTLSDFWSYAKLKHIFVIHITIKLQFTLSFYYISVPKTFSNLHLAKQTFQVFLFFVTFIIPGSTERRKFDRNGYTLQLFVIWGFMLLPWPFEEVGSLSFGLRNFSDIIGQTWATSEFRITQFTSKN